MGKFDFGLWVLRTNSVCKRFMLYLDLAMRVPPAFRDDGLSQLNFEILPYDTYIGS